MVDLIGYVAQIAMAAAIGDYLIDLATTPSTIVTIMVLMIFIGTRMRGLNNIVHECSHSTFSDTRPDNTLIGKVCAGLLLNSFRDYRDEHLSHHAHLGDYDHDLDLQGIKDLRIHDPLTTRVVLRHLVSPFLGRHFPYYLNMNLSGRDGRIFQIMKFGFLAAVAAFIIYTPVTGLLFVILPYALIYSSLNYWADCLDHHGVGR